MNSDFGFRTPLNHNKKPVNNFLEHIRKIASGNFSPVKTEDVADEIKLSEVSPPSGPARRFSKKPEVKAAFKKRYGDRWKEVMYATAWKMHNR